MQHVPILIAGGGPVGLTLSLVLARLGVPAMLVERNLETTRHPKMDITNSRSMEIFRGLGLAPALRAVAVPETHPFDVSWVTTMAGHELHRFRYPSPAQKRRQIETRNDGSEPLEPAMRVSQVLIEPVLKRAVRAQPSIVSRFGVALESCEQDADGVVASLRDVSSGGTERVRCNYLAGCDGGASIVRKCLGIKLEGRARVAQRYMVHIRSEARDILQRWGIAWHYQSPLGTLVAQDDVDKWTLLSRHDVPEDVVGIDPYAVLEKFLGRRIDAEIMLANGWTPHLLVAERYVHGRVVLVGDAAHQYIPTGGYGMNTGIGDALAAGWKLAALALGFGGAGLLEAYDVERRQVGQRNCRAAEQHSDVRAAIARAYAQAGAAIHDPAAAGDAARAVLSGRIAALGNAENESFGIELGYAYPHSPIVCGETDSEHSDEPLRYVPTSAPGARLPSVLLSDGSALFDKLGRWFTLLALGVAPDADLVAAAVRRGVPLEVVRVDEPRLAAIYRAPQLLVRPDQHVAWRGVEAGGRADSILARCLGQADG